MNRNKIILSAIGGAALVGAAVTGYLLWSASDDQSMKAEDLEAAKSSVLRINAAKVAPTEAAVAAIVSNRTVLAAWRDEALALASVGDFRVKSDMTAEAFKRMIVDDAREMSKLPGGVSGRLVKEAFGFGFADFVTGSALPDLAKVPLLQRQWREIKFFAETLSACGATELVEIAVVEKAVEPEPAPEPRNARRRGRKTEEAKPDPVTAQAYALKFSARPAALVKTVNALATAERFVTVDDFEFVRESDVLQERMGGGKDKDAAGGRRRGRRNRPVDEAAADDEENNRKGLVTDPEMDPPFIVTMKLTTYDFGNAPVASDTPGEGADEAGSDSKEGEE